VAHRYHRPVPTYSEFHHVIPQAWQQFWTPPGMKPVAVAGVDALREGDPSQLRLLWDTRRVVLCRTGHGNVHFWLVRAMTAYTATLDDLGSNPQRFIDEAWALVRAGAKKDRLRLNSKEAAIARLAMDRWQRAGGELVALCHAGLYGGI
jgi:hypothetical protein